MDIYTSPDFASAALITIDTQCDTLDGQPLEIAGTSAALPVMVRLLNAFRGAKRPIVLLVEDAISGLYERGRTEMQNIGVAVMSANEVIEQVNIAHV